MESTVRHRTRLLLLVGSILIATAPIEVAGPAQAASPGTLAGTITDYTGAPVAGAQVAASPDGLAWYRQAVTGPNGQFSMIVTPAVSHKVRVRAPGGLEQYAPGQISADSGGAYTAAAGQTTQINEQLLPSGNVQLSLLDGTSSAPVTRGCVRISTNTSSLCDHPDGRYSFVGVPLGNLQVTVDRTKTSWPTTTSISVEPGFGDYPLRLNPAAAIQTTVVAADNEATHPAVCVFAVYRGVDPMTNLNCDVDPTSGSLLIGPLASTSVQLFAVSPDTFDNSKPYHPAYGAQWVGLNGGTGDQRLARKIRTAAGTVSAIPPIRLDHAGSIAGRLDDPYYGESGTRAYVRPFGLQDGLRSIGARIDEAGLLQYAYVGGWYELAGLGPYAWPVEFMGDRGVYGDQWSGNAVNRYLATPVQVEAGSVSTLNATLVYAPTSLSGEIRLTSGTPTGTFWVSAENATTGDSTGIRQVNGNAFTIQGLNADHVRLRYGMIGGPTLTCLFFVPRQGLELTNIVLTLPTASSCARQPAPRWARPGLENPVPRAAQPSFGNPFPWAAAPSWGNPAFRRSPAPAAIRARRG